MSEAGTGRSERMLGALGRLLTACADTIVPPCCVACRARISTHRLLCANCWREVNFIRPPLCDVLGIPLPYDTGGRTVSAAAEARRPPFDRARAAAHYGGVVRTLMHRLKFADRHDVRLLLGRWLVDATQELLPGADLIVPVPLSRSRLFLRQFNQSALLARELARATGLAFDPLILQRHRATPSQVGLTRDQRERNVAGAFSVPAGRRRKLQGMSVLLVDDVVTTGATVEACARTLKRAGAARVDVVAVAMVTNESLADV